MPDPTMLWYDYETTGTDPARDRPVQFAAIRTDMALRPMAEPVLWYCAPAPDVLPHPEACLLTGIAPQDAARNGSIEAAFAAAVREALTEPGTCSAGFNSIRFDDEVNRNLFYRNFFDPYEHAWKSGNSRWDVLDLMRACYALRPAGIEWPVRDDGSPSFRLEDLAAANRIEQRRAHDALCDVEATIGLARLLCGRQPRLYDWALRLRDKRRVASMVNACLPAMKPLLHVSGRYNAARGCLAMVAPIAASPGRDGKFIVADLDVDPAQWTGLDPQDLAERMFTARADLPEGVGRPPLKEVHANRSPFLAPVAALQSVDVQRIGLDVDRCRSHLDAIRSADGLVERVQRAFALRDAARPESLDPELALYAGFPSDADRRRFEAVRATLPMELAATHFAFADPRYGELLFRYRARNWPDTLDVAERDCWREFVRNRLTRDTEPGTLTYSRYFAEIAALRTRAAPGPQQAMLDQLQDWGESIAREFGP
jgi:exodeoxyribonuclease I